MLVRDCLSATGKAEVRHSPNAASFARILRASDVQCGLLGVSPPSATRSAPVARRILLSGSGHLGEL